MAYVDPDYRTKKAFKAAVVSGEKHYTYNPSGMFPTKTDGNTVVEGPHYPKAHSWYASVVVRDGVVVSVK
jgi:hypothetical protein